MVMKYKIAALTDVPEALRSEYKPDPAGGYVLDAEGVVPKERLDEFRNNNIALQQQIDKYKDVDPVKYKELMQIQRRIQEKELIDKGDVDKLVELRVATMRDELTGQVNTLNTSLATATQTLSVLMIDNKVKDAAVKLGVTPTAMDDVVLRAHTTYKVDNGQAVPKDGKGQVIYGKDGKSPMDIEEWMTGLKKTAPHLFLGTTGSGATGGNLGTVGFDITKASPLDKINEGLKAGGLLANLPGA
jgi:hypothetical protein